MEQKLKISRKEFKKTIKNRIEIGKTIFDELSKARTTDVFNELKLEYELWNDYNNNFLKASFTKEKNEELDTYNEGIAYIELMSVMTNSIDSEALKHNEILQKITKQQLNLKKIENRIQFYEEISDFEKEKVIGQIELFSLDLVKDTPSYIQKIAKQIILCYNYTLFDSCLVMLRKLIESLIIECYEKNKIQHKVQDSRTGNYFFLSDLISHFTSEKTWTLTRNTKDALPKIKKYADLSAHNRRFNARKNDIDQIKLELRIVIEELVNITE